MLEYFVKRLLLIIPKLLVVTMLIFFGLELLPIDPLTIAMDPDTALTMTEEQLEALREEKGLNDPAPMRYLRWLGNLLKGDFGYSLSTGIPIRELIASRFPATLELCLVATLLSSVFGILLGCLSSRFKNTPIDYSNTVVGLVGTSVPGFFFAMCFILLFSIKLKWLPPGGRMTAGKTEFFDRIEYMVLPTICMAITHIAGLMRLTRNSMLDVINKDYVKTARAKGEGETGIFLKHCFRNGCTPVVLSLLGRLSVLVSGTTVIETVFNYPGMGLLMINSITANDMPVAMIILLLCAVMVMLISFFGDIAIALLDPRVRFGKEA